jgi:hypothetical protein
MTAVFSWQTWMNSKTSLARRLAAGECGGGYPEAVIVLSSAISAIAAFVWPGDRIDRKRFVELFKEFCDPNLNPTRISIPQLIGQLRASGQSAACQKLQEEFMGYVPAQVLKGDDVDQDEPSVLATWPGLARKDVRSCCYADLLYKEVRSALVHEYRLGGKADPWPMADDADDVISYVNWHGEPDRHIHFPIGWVCLCAESIAAAVDNLANAFPRTPPAAWWLETH